MNPIDIIEHAELQAEKVVLESGSKRIEIIKIAQEEAGESSIKALQTAEATAESILSSARQESQKKQNAGHKALEQELFDLRKNSKERQPQAVANILKLLPTLI